jgi:predicted nucleic acid-binding protein
LLVSAAPPACPRPGADSGAAPRAVLDTNVLLDLWLFDEPSTRALRAAVESGAVRALRSTATDAEFADVLGRARFGLDEAARAAVLARWAACSEPIAAVFPAPLACTDRDDQKFLDAAFSARADLLLTRDRALLRLARRAGAAGLAIRGPTWPIAYDRMAG